MFPWCFITWPVTFQFPHEQLDLKHLTFKLAMLLLLLTVQRGQTIHWVNTRSVSVKDNTLHIFVDNLVKQSKPGRRQPEFTLSQFSENSAMCVVTVYLEYIRRTQPFRAARNDSPLLTPWSRKRVYVQLWPMAKFHAQIWLVLKIGLYLRNRSS